MNQSANFCFLFAGLGMMVVGLVPMIWWKIKKKISWRWVWWGISLISLAIGVKVVVGIFLNTRVQFLFDSLFPPKFSSLLFFLYLGLLTVLTEVWLTYRIIRSRLAKAGLNDAVGFGLGYGGAEAVGLGFYSLLVVLILILTPQILPQAWRQEALSTSCFLTVAPILERIATVGLHLLVSLWLWQAAFQGKIKFFIYAVLLKGGVDSLALPLQSLAQSGASGVFLAEVPIVILGLAAFVLLINFFRPPKKIINISAVCLFILGLVAFFLVFRFAPQGPQSSGLPSSGLEGQPAINPTCIYPVVMSGQAFEPMIPDGKRLMMNKCVEDKNNLPEKTIVLFKQGNSLKLGIIIGRNEFQEGLFYRLSRRLNTLVEETIKAEEVIAIWQSEELK